MENNINIVFQIIGVSLFLFQIYVTILLIKSVFEKPKPICKITLLDNTAKRLDHKQQEQESDEAYHSASFLLLIRLGFY